MVASTALEKVDHEKRIALPHRLIHAPRRIRVRHSLIEYMSLWVLNFGFQNDSILRISRVVVGLVQWSSYVEANFHPCLPTGTGWNGFETPERDSLADFIEATGNCLK